MKKEKVKQIIIDFISGFFSSLCGGLIGGYVVYIAHNLGLL